MTGAAAAAVVLAMALAAYPLAEPVRIRGLLGLTGVVGVALVAATVLAGRPGLLPGGPAVLLGSYGVSLLGRAQLDLGVVGYAAGLLLLAALTALAVEDLPVPTGATGRRPPPGRLPAVALAGAGGAALVVATVAAPLATGVALQAAGVGAAAAIVGLLGLLLRTRL